MHGTYPIMHRLERLALAKAYIALTDSRFRVRQETADHLLLLIGSAIASSDAGQIAASDYVPHFRLHSLLLLLGFKRVGHPSRLQI